MSASFWNIARRLHKPSTPGQFPTTGFETIGCSHLVEEEQWEWYKPEEFYPFRYKHVTLKVGTPRALERELRALRHFGTIHPASLLICQMFSEFYVNTVNGLFSMCCAPASRYLCQGV